MKITGTRSCDITFCAANCADKECARNKKRLRSISNVAIYNSRSTQDFSKECVDFKEGK